LEHRISRGWGGGSGKPFTIPTQSPERMQKLASFGARANGFVRRLTHLASGFVRREGQWLRSAPGESPRLARDVGVQGMPYADPPKWQWLRSGRRGLASFGAIGFARRPVFFSGQRPPARGHQPPSSVASARSELARSGWGRRSHPHHRRASQSRPPIPGTTDRFSRQTQPRPIEGLRCCGADRGAYPEMKGSGKTPRDRRRPR
jgi:hypothetical protein